MDNQFLDLCHAELEIYLGKYIEGDITPLVFMLLKDTKNKRALLEYLGEFVPIEDKKESAIERPNFSKLFESSLVVKE